MKPDSRSAAGMGTTFGVIGGTIALTITVSSIFLSPEPLDRAELPFMMVATVGWFGISFGLGMIYSGLLTLAARGRSLRDVSVARVELAGAVVGMLPAVFVIAGGAAIPDVVRTLAIFPPVSGAVATAALLIARRGQAES